MTFLSEPDTRETAAERDLKQRLIRFLHARQVPGTLTIQILVRHGSVILRGTLPSPQAKRLCLECCRHVAGVRELKDESTVGARA
jgi:osmotically-inducible protein OsmY